MSSPTTATIVSTSGSTRTQYEMFDVKAIDAERAVLSGPLFLEVGQQISLQVSIAGDPLSLQAKVKSVSPQDEEMTVVFVELTDQAKTLLQSQD